MEMSVRQRLRTTLDSRKNQQRCWRCALGSPRHSSTAQQPRFEDVNQGDLHAAQVSTQPNESWTRTMRRWRNRRRYYGLGSAGFLRDGRNQTPKSDVEERGLENEPDPTMLFLKPRFLRGQMSMIPVPQPSTKDVPALNVVLRGSPPVQKLKDVNGTEETKDNRQEGINHLGRSSYHDKATVFNDRDSQTHVRKKWSIPITPLIRKGPVKLRKVPVINDRVPHIHVHKEWKRPVICHDRTKPQIPVIRFSQEKPLKLRKHSSISTPPGYDWVEYVAQSDKVTHLIQTEGPTTYNKNNDEDDFHEELNFILDEFKHVQRLRAPKTITYTSSTPMQEAGLHAPSEWQSLRVASRMRERDSWDKSRRPYSTASTLARTNRHYTTAASQTPRGIAQLHPPRTQTVNPESTFNGRDIRKHLKIWQKQHNILAEAAAFTAPLSSGASAIGQNMYTQSGEDDSFTVISQDDEAEDEDDVLLSPDDATQDISKNYQFLRRGDLVELPTVPEPVLAIFVRNSIEQAQFYTMRGEWVNRTTRAVAFAVSGFVHPDEVNSILPYLPADEVEGHCRNKLQPLGVNAPRDAGAGLIEKMLLFHQAADSVFRRNADRISRVYELIAPSKEEGRSQRGLRGIAMIVLEKTDPAELTQAMLWAVHKALLSSQNVLLASMDNRQNPQYEILPRQNLSNIAQVQQWVREFQEGIIEEATQAFSNERPSGIAARSLNPISTFVEKAQVAIKQSRETRPLGSDGHIGISKVKVEPLAPSFKTYRMINGQPFDSNERIIICYLDAWVTSDYLNRHTNLASLGPMILRATGMYNGFELARPIGLTFLQELGIVAPWENRLVYKVRSLRLPGHDTVSEETTRLRLKAKQWLHLPGTEYKDPRQLEDSMEKLRWDWGDLPVFCIDSAGTLEHDDGVSLQRVDGSSSEYWIHVHVANPSAFIRPDSPMADYAAQLGETVYFPERIYPMLLPSVTHRQFSLADDRPCLTISARVSITGDILEKKITSGIVRNVHYLTPHELDEKLGLNVSGLPESISVLTVGGKFPSIPQDQHPKPQKVLSDSDIDVLRKLTELGKALHRKRYEAGAPDFYPTRRVGRTSPQVFLTNGPERPFQINANCVRRFEGDPIIGVESKTYVGGNTIVADLMVLAGYVAASWCLERNIPIPYRGIERSPEPPMLPEDYIREVIDPKAARYGYTDEVDLLQYMRLVGQSSISASPLEHPILGLAAYCKATSPLRRYFDLYTHWQIEAALRHEKETGISLIGSTEESYLVFSRAEVEESANATLQLERRIRNAKSWAERHWVVQAFARAFYFNDGQLPTTFKVATIGRRDSVAQKGWLEDWCVKVILEENDVVAQQGGYQAGDVWETKISYVDTYACNVGMMPLQLLRRETPDNLTILKRNKDASSRYN